MLLVDTGLRDNALAAEVLVDTVLHDRGRGHCAL
jgi:hypothetical protein